MSIAEALEPAVPTRFGSRKAFFLYTTRSLEWLRNEWQVEDFLALWQKVLELRPRLEGGADQGAGVSLANGGGIDLFAAKGLVIAGVLECLAREIDDDSELIPEEAVKIARRTVNRMVPANLLVLSVQAMTAFYRAMLMPQEMIEEAGEDASPRPMEAPPKEAA
jgi:hypothetical protein